MDRRVWTSHFALGTLLFALISVLLHCGPTGQTTIGRPYQISLPPIPEGERLSYRIMTRGQEIGRMVCQVRRSQFLGTSALQVVTATQITSGSVMRRDSAVVYATCDSLAPIASFHFQWVGNAFTTAAAKYQPGSVGVSTYSPQQGEMQRPLPLGPASYDIGELTTLCRALQIGPGKSAEVTVVIPLSTPPGGVTRAATITPKGDETVTVPAGSFESSRLTIRMENTETELWLEKGPTRRLVKYQAPGQAYIMELVPVR